MRRKMTKFIHLNLPNYPDQSPSFRRKCQSRTVAVEALPGNTVRDLAVAFMAMGAGLKTTLSVGVTFLSLKDRYCKRTGRAEAIKRMGEIDLEIRGVTITPTHIFVELEEHKGVNMLLRVNKLTGFSTVTGHLSIGE
jgi:hypothetical protein